MLLVSRVVSDDFPNTALGRNSASFSLHTTMTKWYATKRRGVRLAFTAVYTSLVVAIESAGAQGLTPNCTLPFQRISKHHSIDDNCAARGEVPDPPVAANDPAHALQNQAKSNFCATGNWNWGQGANLDTFSFSLCSLARDPLISICQDLHTDPYSIQSICFDG
jgi:hypothetical protein